MKSKLAIVALAAALCLAQAAVALPRSVSGLSAFLQGQQLTPVYLSEMPSVERVLSEVKGTDDADTLARQIGALWQMEKIIDDMAFGLEHRTRNKFTADENRLRGQYDAAFNKLRPTISDRSFKGLRGYDDDPKFRAVLLNQFFSESFRDLYAKADAKFMTVLKANAQPQTNIFGAEQAPGSGASSAQMGDSLRSLTKGLAGLLGAKPPDGLRLNGIYKGEGVRVTFSGTGAIVTCADLAPEGREYSVEQTAQEIRVTIKNEGQPMVVVLRTDGRLAGPGPVNVAGKVQVGTRKVWIPDQQNNLYYGYPTTGHYADEPVYKPKSARCTYGVMAPNGAVASTLGGAERFAEQMAGQHPQEFKITPGVRLVGLYGGPGSAIEFEEDSATIKCGGNKRELAYAVVPSGNQWLVKIDGGGTLTLGAGGRLIGEGGNAGCNLGTLALGGAPVMGGASASAAGGHPGGNGGVQSGPAVLALASGLSAQAEGKNVLGGHTFGLSKEDFATVLTKAGFHPPAGTSVISAWAEACKNRSPVCQQGFNAQGSASVGTVTLDASGKAIFSSVPAGTYYVFGSTRYGNGHLLWDVRVELAPGTQTLTLNERNAMPME